MNSFIRKTVPVSDCTVEKKSSSNSQLMTQECDMPVPHKARERRLLNQQLQKYNVRCTSNKYKTNGN